MPNILAKYTTLTATYTSPSLSQSFTHPLPSSMTTSTAEKTEYLSNLRQSVTKLQDEINTFLTEKMEEDKALAAKAGLKVDEKKEEERYGEEDVEDEG
ncbi:MAG: hypothetical protein L6R41_003856 [Letrouitia leprolyta]|nr:MAG: hypothetical protein L6R41_003856 [Letrouitia leprolyta]